MLDTSDTRRINTIDRLPFDLQTRIVGPILKERVCRALYDSPDSAGCPILGSLVRPDDDELRAWWWGVDGPPEKKMASPTDLSNALTLIARAVAPALCAADDGSHRPPRCVSPNSTPRIDALDLSANLDRVGLWDLNVGFFPLRPGQEGVVWSSTYGYEFWELEGAYSHDSDNELGESCKSVRTRMCAIERRVQQLRI